MWLAADQLGVDSVYSEELNRVAQGSARLECRRRLASQGRLPLFRRDGKPCKARVWSASWWGPSLNGRIFKCMHLGRYLFLCVNPGAWNQSASVSSSCLWVKHPVAGTSEWREREQNASRPLYSLWASLGSTYRVGGFSWLTICLWNFSSEDKR